MDKALAAGHIRWALLLEYDGTGLVGWQRQTNGLSVQAALEDATAALFNGSPIASAAAGRTDAGVHAAAMVVQVDVPDQRSLSPHQFRDGINYYLKPNMIGVKAAVRAPAGWHARFSATARRYRYTILNRATRPILDAKRVWHLKHPLNVQEMQDAATLLIGRHDFSSFRAASCQAKGPIRTLEEARVKRYGDIVTLDVEAQSFLHHQVRNIAGSLALVGRGRWTVDTMRAVLDARDRGQAGPTAPPEGLCLTQVRYREALFPDIS